jgi:hypothetical protein
MDTNLERYNTNDDIKEICEDLKLFQSKSESPDEYEKVIAKAFSRLGFSTRVISGSGNTDVLANANIGKMSYKINLDGKTSKNNKISESQINWVSLQDHKEKTGADFVVLVGPGFSGGNLLSRAKDFNVCLLKTDEIINLLESHKDFPFSLLELRDLFMDWGPRKSYVDELISQNNVRLSLLANLIVIIEEMESLQERLGYFTFESLAGRQRLENHEIELSDVRDTIELLKLPFLNAIIEISESKYLLVMEKDSLSNIFLKLGKSFSSLSSEIKPIQDIKGNENRIDSEIMGKFGGTKYYSWEQRENSIAAYARKDKPYVHHCPLDHFVKIFDLIEENLIRLPIINVSTIFKDLEKSGFHKDRLFKGRAEDYKIRMSLGILEIEGLLKWTGRKSPIEYTANIPIDEFQSWFESKIIYLSNV